MHQNEVTVTVSVTGRRLGYLDPPEEDHEIQRYRVRLTTEGASRRPAVQALSAVSSDWNSWFIHRSKGSQAYDMPGVGAVTLTVDLGGNVTDIAVSKTFTIAAEANGGSLLNALNAAFTTAYENAETWLEPKRERLAMPFQPARRPMGFWEALFSGRGPRTASTP